MNAEVLRGQFAAEVHWNSRADGWWLEDPVPDVRVAAQTMLESGARLVTLTALPPAKGTIEGATHLYYHWDLEGCLLSLGTTVTEAVSSIVDLCPGADWVEREIHDYFGIQFTGRESLLPLVSREGYPSVFGPTPSDDGRASSGARGGGPG